MDATPTRAPVTPQPAAGATPPAPNRRRLPLIGGLIAVIVVVVLVIALVSGGGSSPTQAAAGPARIVPADALAYVDIAFGDSQPAFRQATAVLRRMPDLPLIGAAAVSKIGTILSGGRSVDFSAQIAPWIGKQAALALLNTKTSTAGSLIIIDVKNHARAETFVKDMGATGDGSYRGHALMHYPSGAELGFIDGNLVIGQSASLKAAIDTVSGGHPLATDATYTKVSAGQPTGGVLTAYASLAGVRRVLAAQSGVLGALGNVLYQPRLAGVGLTVVPDSTGAHIQVHTALSGSPSGTSTAPFTPTMASVFPAGATLMLDVSGLDKVAPQVLNAGSAAGIAGGLGPLISRLGIALVSEGVKVSDLTSLFDHESAVGIVGTGRNATLVVAARTPDPAKSQADLAKIQAPLEKLFRSPSKKVAYASPHFVTRKVDGVTVHQIQLTVGLQINYAVFHGLVVISTAQSGIAVIAAQQNRLASDPNYAAVLASHPSQVSSLVYANLGALLGLSSAARSTSTTSLLARLAPDLAKLGAAGLTSARTGSDSTTELNLQVR